MLFKRFGSERGTVNRIAVRRVDEVVGGLLLGGTLEHVHILRGMK